MATPPPELQEKDFIQESYPKNPYPLWLWLVLLSVVAALFWGGTAWFQERRKEKILTDPFLQVTNRDFSLFLWENPEYMRAHMRSKLGYLPAFRYEDKVSVDPELADQPIVAPREIVFLYHVWDRLVGHDIIPCPIPVSTFGQFLKDLEEWLPKNWKDAPKEYVALVTSLPTRKPDENLFLLSQNELPNSVRDAFLGWKNYLLDAEKINQLKPTYGQMKEFLVAHPNFARNFWRNILSERTPKYLQTLFSGHYTDSDTIPDEELAPFLRVAFYNFKNCANLHS